MRQRQEKGHTGDIREGMDRRLHVGAREHVCRKTCTSGPGTRRDSAYDRVVVFTREDGHLSKKKATHLELAGPGCRQRLRLQLCVGCKHGRVWVCCFLLSYSLAGGSPISLANLAGKIDYIILAAEQAPPLLVHPPTHTPHTHAHTTHTRSVDSKPHAPLSQERRGAPN